MPTRHTSLLSEVVAMFLHVQTPVWLWPPFQLLPQGTYVFVPWAPRYQGPLISDPSTSLQEKLSNGSLVNWRALLSNAKLTHVLSGHNPLGLAPTRDKQGSPNAKQSGIRKRLWLLPLRVQPNSGCHPPSSVLSLAWAPAW